MFGFYLDTREYRKCASADIGLIFNTPEDAIRGAMDYCANNKISLLSISIKVYLID